MNNELIEQIKANVPLVYEAGKNKGIEEMEPQLEEKYSEGIEEGLDTAITVQEGFLENQPQTHYDIFWDAYQNKGTRVDYTCGFAGSGWNELNFKPKYKIKPQNALQMFRYNAMQIDLVEHLALLGVELDFSSAWQMMYCFQDSKFTRVGVIDVRGCNGSNASYLFQNNTSLKTIDLLKVKDTTYFSSDFENCTALENITIEGTIGKNVNFQWSTKLNKASIESIINALSTTTSGLTVTLSQTAVNKAFETVEGAADGSTSVEWIALAGNETTEGVRPNWTISLM